MKKVVIKFNRCKGCGYCIDSCKKDCLQIDPEQRNGNGYAVAVFDQAAGCSGCAICAEVCPDAAIEVYK